MSRRRPGLGFTYPGSSRYIFHLWLSALARCLSELFSLSGAVRVRTILKL